MSVRLESGAGRGTERALIFGVERFAQIFNRSDEAAFDRPNKVSIIPAFAYRADKATLDTDIAGMVAAMTEGELRRQSERASNPVHGEPRQRSEAGKAVGGSV